jgi:hypothetical protein
MLLGNHGASHHHSYQFPLRPSILARYRGQFEFREQPQRWRLPYDVPVLRQRAQRLREGAVWERAGERTLEIREKKHGASGGDLR